MELWNGNSDSIHENVSHCNGDLQNQLTQVTDELNQLKMQLASPQTNDNLKDSRADIPNVQGGNCDDQIRSVSYTFNVSQKTEQTTSLFKSLGLDVTEDNEDNKDRKIEILSNKLIESDKEANELKKEIERLRDIIKQKTG